MPDFDERRERPRAWTVVPVDDRALRIRSYEDGDDIAATFVVWERQPVPVTDEMARRLAIYEHGRTEGQMDWARRALDVALNGGSKESGT